MHRTSDIVYQMLYIYNLKINNMHKNNRQKNVQLLKTVLSTGTHALVLLLCQSVFRGHVLFCESLYNTSMPTTP